MTERISDLKGDNVDFRMDELNSKAFTFIGIDTVNQAKLPTPTTNAGPWSSQQFETKLNDMTWSPKIFDKIEDKTIKQIMLDIMKEKEQECQIALLKEKQIKMDKRMDELMEEIAKLKSQNEKNEKKQEQMFFSSGTLHFSDVNITKAGYFLRPNGDRETKDIFPA
jgi:hypothetical protein